MQNDDNKLDEVQNSNRLDQEIEQIDQEDAQFKEAQLAQILQQEQKYSEQKDQEQNQQVKQNNQKTSIPKKPLSAFTVFLKENGQGGLSIKDKSKLWGQLSTHQKQVYQQKFLQQKFIYQKYVSQHGTPVQTQLKKNIFPLSRIKAICKSDKQVGKISSDAVRYIQGATRQFIKLLVSQSIKGSQRKQITQKQLQQALTRKQQFWFLRGVLCKNVKKKQIKQQKMSKQRLKGQTTLI